MVYEKLCLNCMKEKKDAEGRCPYCGFDNSQYQPKDFQLPPYTTLGDGRYVVGKVLGSGGFGITYIAFDMRLETPVAIKELFVADKVKRKQGRTVLMETTENGIREYKDIKRRFMQEAKTMAELENVEGVVKVRDCFNENDTAYIVMEYLDGKTLKEIRRENKQKMSMDQAIALFEPLMRSLSQMHKAGIIHRDISLDNIMVTKDGRIKLIDLGGEKRVGNYGENDRTTIIKKSVYTPVEQIMGKSSNIGPWTDVYALAVTIYICICGIFPKAAGERENDKDIKKPSEIGVKITPKQEEVLLKALAIDRKNRIQTVDQLLEGLKQEGKKPKKSKGPLGAVIAIAAGILIGVAVKEKSGEWIEKKDTTKTNSEIEMKSDASVLENAEAGVWYYISSTYKDGIAVRSEPTGESEQLTRIPYGTEFYVEKTEKNWGYTRINGVSGWIALDYASPLEGEKVDSWYRITSTYKDGIAVRSEPTGESEQLTRLPYGTEFYVEKTEKNWGYTTINGVSGWIALDYAEIIEKAEPSASQNTEANGSTEITNYDQALFYQQCNALLNVNVGDEVKFGAYEQDNNPSNGKEEIEWEVLEKKDNQILVISKKALDVQEYWDSFENTDWEASEMRKWLNESFFQNAFSQYHQSLIMDTAVTADQNPDYQTDTGASTTDKIYLLSMDEVQRYFPDIESRNCQPTVYTKVKGVAIQNLNTWWWLRTSGKDRKHMAVVYFDGEMKSDGFRVYVKDGGVRPAMWINLSDISEVEVPQEFFQEQSECKGIVAINPACVGTTDDTTYMEAMAPGQAEEECTFSTGVTGKVTGVQENQIDLGVAKQLQKILLERGYQVVMLREDDESRLSSANRAIAAAESEADIQILISCRKRQDLGEKGAMAYLPKKENPNVGYMYDDCYRLSQCVLSQYCAEDLFENNGFYETDTSRTINWSKIPITNIMLGCISDESDEQKMADQNNWAIMAEGIANGIDAYFEQNQ